MFVNENLVDRADQGRSEFVKLFVKSVLIRFDPPDPRLEKLENRNFF
jgi:hypothetical protein